MSRNKPQITTEQARTGYWEACALYETVRTDPYSTYTQIKDAADAVARWRQEWIKAIRRKEGAKRDPKNAMLDAIKGFCSETGEDVNWVLKHAKRS